MIKETIIEKITSRKFWVGVAVIVVGIILCFSGYVEAGRRLILIGAGGYLGAETVCDVARNIWPTYEIEIEEGQEDTPEESETEEEAENEA